MALPESVKLTPFSYVVLILVGEHGAGPHDLVRMMRAGRVYWTAAESQYYSEPKRLADAGLLEARREPGRTRERTHYMLTAAGRAAVADWLEQPSGFVRLQNEPAVRLLGADLARDAKAVVDSLQAIRQDIDEQRRQLATAREIARGLPHREPYLRLNHDLSSRLLDAFEEWLDAVERELS
jgi:DNA-binding PadR family transcriptional regulator